VRWEVYPGNQAGRHS